VRSLHLARAGDRLRILCLGAHSDDIEIGAGATILDLIRRGIQLEVDWVVLSAIGIRAEEARASAQAFLTGAARQEIVLATLKDGYFPFQGAELKDHFTRFTATCTPDIILTHRHDDAHQDHRQVSKLAWTSFRDHVILEYEIPKWDGDMGRPNAYMPVSDAALKRKTELLTRYFGTQRSKDWFDARTFEGLARLRGAECRAPSGYAEAFHARKILLA
jgi:LmbE family N-acetylglucosaminyl deacetylase